MAMKSPYDKYSNNSIFTASKEELTLKLYEGALKFCNQAIAALEEKNYEKANVLIVKVQNIIREFQLTLDRKYEVSNYFATMYEYIYRRLVEANMGKDLVILEEVRELLRSFRDMWKEAMAISKKS